MCAHWRVNCVLTEFVRHYESSLGEFGRTIATPGEWLEIDVYSMWEHPTFTRHISDLRRTCQSGSLIEYGCSRSLVVVLEVKYGKRISIDAFESAKTQELFLTFTKRIGEEFQCRVVISRSPECHCTDKDFRQEENILGVAVTVVDNASWYSMRVEDLRPRRNGEVVFFSWLPGNAVAALDIRKVCSVARTEYRLWCCSGS